jgi:hypothetical protein
MTMPCTSSNFCKNAARLVCRGLDGTSARGVLAAATVVVTDGEGARIDGGIADEVVDSLVGRATVAVGVPVPVWGWRNDTERAVDVGDKNDGASVADEDAEMDAGATDTQDLASASSWAPSLTGWDGPGVADTGSKIMGPGAACPSRGENCNVAPRTGEVSGVGAADSGMVLISHERTDFGVWRCNPGLPNVGWRSRMRWISASFNGKKVKANKSPNGTSLNMDDCNQSTKVLH